MSFVQAYLRLIGIVTAVLGTMLLLWPADVIGIFFNQVGSQTEFFARIAGSTLIGYSVLNLLASKYKSFEIQQITVWGNLTTLTIASLITIGYLNSFDSFGWLIVGQHVFFTAGFVVCLLKLKNS